MKSSKLVKSLLVHLSTSAKFRTPTKRVQINKGKGVCILAKHAQNTYLPDAKLGVVDHVVGHSELGLVLRRVDRLDLSHYAPLVHQNLTVVLRHIWQHRHHQWVLALGLSQPLGQTNHPFHVVAVPGQESHVGPARSARSLGQP